MIAAIPNGRPARDLTETNPGKRSMWGGPCGFTGSLKDWTQRPSFQREQPLIVLHFVAFMSQGIAENLRAVISHFMEAKILLWYQ